MSLQSAPYYWLTCDQEGCAARSTEDGDYAAWSDDGQAYDDALNGDWWTGKDGKDYCYQHVPRCACGNSLEDDGSCADADVEGHDAECEAKS